MPYKRSVLGRYGALAEIVGVFFIGGLIGSLMMQAAGITGHPLAGLMGENPDMVAISFETAKVLLLQYIGWLGLALFFTLALKRKPLQDRGFTMGNTTLFALVIMGIAAWAIGDLPNKIMWVLDAEYDLGTSVPWREALLSAEKTPGWWLLMAVGSFGLIPIVEEVFWRGYVQSRLQESFSPAFALIATSAMFTLSHGQYHQADFYHAGIIASVFFGSLIMGWVFQQTGSLVPAIIMHAILNFPVDGIWSYLIIALMTAIVAVKWSHYHEALKKLRVSFNHTTWQLPEIITGLTLTLLMVGLTQAPQIASMAGMAAFPLAIISVILFRKKA